MEFTQKEEKRIREYFLISILIKGAISLAEVIAGVVVLFIPVSTFTDLILRYAEGELVENSSDFIATQLIHVAQQLSFAGSTFIAVYLLSRGLIKLILVVALLKNQLWAYPASLFVLGLFVVYQCYQLTAGFSAFLLGLTIFDLIVMWFIWREYEVIRLHKA
jgi:uncharacterized membrane protein